jgi:hypothetical protein
VNDDSDHYPINDLAHARNALARVNQFPKPPWFNGTLEELKKAVVDKVKEKFPSINITDASLT